MVSAISEKCLSNPDSSSGTNSNPRVSVIVVNYNTGALLTRCIEAVGPQACEVIIVDNASRDASIEMLKRNSPPSSSIRLILNERNTGFAAACNIGLRHTSSDYLLFLNPDCTVASGAVERLVDELQHDPSAGMAGGLLQNIDGSEQAGARRTLPTPWRAFVRAFGLNVLGRRWPGRFPDFNLNRQPLPDKAIEVEAISGAFLMARRAALEQVGTWDEGYFLHCEDLDLCQRFRILGWRILFVPDARAVHIHNASGRSRLWFVEWHKHRGMLRYYRKFFAHSYPKMLLMLVIAGVWLRFAVVTSAIAVRRLLRPRANPGE